MQPALILHHHEITLKGKNRQYFERQLLKNTREVLRGLIPAERVTGGYGRFVVDLEREDPREEALARLGRVFGIANICPGLRVEQSLEAFCRAAETLLEGKKFATIRVDTRRPDKRFSTPSMEVNARVGEFLCSRFGVRANLSTPDQTVYIEIVNGVAYVYDSKLKGAGGLPSGISGRVVMLISAGFDSPVAAWRMMKRGARVIFVHFHSMPYTSTHSVDQVRQLMRVLVRYQLLAKLYIVPFAEIQNEIVLAVPEALRVIFYRRMMIRVAERVARREDAEALVTGEALGQVASQTLRNIRVIDEAATLPILRPLAGMDKEETMQLAREIGTYDISKEPYDDCCSFLAPRNPETWADPAAVQKAEQRIDIERLLEKAEGMSVESFRYPESAEPSHA
jgi:thiamine biosynthesis protein ThiI